jgi:hypothetical protein
MPNPVSSVLSLVKDAARSLAARRRDAIERKRGYKRALLDRVAERVRIKRIEASDEIGDSLAGWVDGFYVEIDAGPFSSKWRPIDRVRIEIDGEGAIPESLVIAPKIMWDSQLEREVPAPRRPPVLRAQDGPRRERPPAVAFPLEHFASAISIAGDELIAYALLDDRARKDVMTLVAEYGVWVMDGAMVWESGQIPVTADLITDMAWRMLSLARRLVLKPSEIPERLSSNARGDPAPDVRRQNLVLAIVHHPTAEETLSACRSAIHGDQNVFVRIQAAKHLGEEGLETLKSIAGAEYGNDHARLSALQHIARNHPKSAPDVLAKLLWASSRRVILASIQALAHLDASFVRPADVESRLIDLAGANDRALRLEAIQLLGRVGAAHSLAALSALTKGMFNDASVKEAARETIRAIEARIGVAEGGRLSIVVSPEGLGSLSLSSDGGAVSVTDAEGALAPVDDSY